MAIRLFPDIMIAYEVRCRMEQIKIQGMGNPKDEDYEIYISTTGMLEKQKNFQWLSVDQAFIGYGDDKWNEEDYEKYISKKESLFKKVIPTLYKVQMDYFFELKKVIGTEEATKQFLKSFLETNNYDIRTLNTFIG